MDPEDDSPEFDVFVDFDKSDPNIKLRKFTRKSTDKFLTWREVMSLWQENERFRDVFISSLMDMPYESFFWETPPLSLNSQDADFEYAVIKAQALEYVQPDPSAFQTYFDTNEYAVSFLNLGRDAVLIVPYPSESDLSTYTHLARFMKQASDDQKHFFWIKVGYTLTQVLSERLPDQRTWVSTCGTGIYWLHLRLDKRPKYYSYSEYANREL